MGGLRHILYVYTYKKSFLFRRNVHFNSVYFFLLLGVRYANVSTFQCLRANKQKRDGQANQKTLVSNLIGGQMKQIDIRHSARI